MFGVVVGALLLPALLTLVFSGSLPESVSRWRWPTVVAAVVLAAAWAIVEVRAGRPDPAEFAVEQIADGSALDRVVARNVGHSPAAAVRFEVVDRPGGHLLVVTTNAAPVTVVPQAATEVRFRSAWQVTGRGLDLLWADRRGDPRQPVDLH
ncbi:hypothetical protein [Longispora urticae]